VLAIVGAVVALLWRDRGLWQAWRSRSRPLRGADLDVRARLVAITCFAASALLIAGLVGGVALSPLLVLLPIAIGGTLLVPVRAVAAWRKRKERLQMEAEHRAKGLPTRRHHWPIMWVAGMWLFAAPIGIPLFLLIIALPVVWLSGNPPGEVVTKAIDVVVVVGYFALGFGHVLIHVIRRWRENNRYWREWHSASSKQRDRRSAPEGRFSLDGPLQRHPGK
jgi:hypothetical protein